MKKVSLRKGIEQLSLFLGNVSTSDVIANEIDKLSFADIKNVR